MTRYSYAEIEIFLTEEENHFCSDLQKRIVSQLLEENRILREGLGKYADHNNWGSLDKDKGWNIEELFRLIGLKGCHGNMWALETLAKADNVRNDS